MKQNIYEMPKIFVNAASLMSCAGNANAVSDVGKLIKSTVPVEVGYTKEGWFCVRFPALLPKKEKSSTDYVRDMLYTALSDFFRQHPTIRYGRCMIAYRHVYDRDYPERHWRDHLLELLFDEDQIAKHTNFEYDAQINGTYILSHRDSDLCRLNRFREAIIDEPDEKYEALCFEWQYDFVKKFLGDFAKVTVISFDKVDKELSEYYSRYLIK